MSTTFPRLRKSKLGYNVDEVEDFLEDARQAYSARPNDAVVVTADGIRRTAFSMQKGGYSPSHVDAALERLEDAFAVRERDRAWAERGDDWWYNEARATAQQVLNRLSRPPGQRFRRTSILTVGYHPKDVDAFGNRLARYFQDGKPIGINEVRSVVFRPKRGGYAEWQVDLLLDAVTRVMLAVR